MLMLRNGLAAPNCVPEIIATLGLVMSLVYVDMHNYTCVVAKEKTTDASWECQFHDVEIQIWARRQWAGALEIQILLWPLCRLYHTLHAGVCWFLSRHYCFRLHFSALHLLNWADQHNKQVFNQMMMIMMMLWGKISTLHSSTLAESAYIKDHCCGNFGASQKVKLGFSQPFLL